MCITTSLIYGLVVGGKPPVPNVPFIIPAYEGTNLFGSVAAFAGCLLYARSGAHICPGTTTRDTRRIATRWKSTARSAKRSASATCSGTPERWRSNRGPDNSPYREEGAFERPAWLTAACVIGIAVGTAALAVGFVVAPLDAWLWLLVEFAHLFGNGDRYACLGSGVSGCAGPLGGGGEPARALSNGIRADRAAVLFALVAGVAKVCAVGRASGG